MRAVIGREPEGTWTTEARLEDGSLQRTVGQVDASYTATFSSDFEKMSIQESDVRKIIAEVQATSWRLRERIRVRELAAAHRLGQMLVCGCSRSRRPGSERPTLIESRP